jgi:hypothetical protein
MNTYIAELHRKSDTNESYGFVARIVIQATDRGRAVHRAQLWYWEKYRGQLGPAHETLVVDDPHGEVRYGPEFNCGAKKNRLLPDAVIAALLEEAHGELMRDARAWRPHHPPGSVRRVRRRRDFGKFVAPNIRQMRNGVLYYRVTRVPQKVRNGRRLRKRKYRDIRLTARTLREAANEIEQRMLLLEHISCSNRRSTQRHSVGYLRACTMYTLH